MEVLLLNTYDWGGAGTATSRIHRGLRRIGINSKMLVQHKRGDDVNIIGPEGQIKTAYAIGRIVSDSWPLKLFGPNDQPFSLNWLPGQLHHRIAALDPDLIHLNWMGDGFLPPKSLSRVEVPVVWRFPDMWPMTGGCHYSDGCNKFTEQCGDCPQLTHSINHDITWWTHRRKQRAWSTADITVVAPSTWLAKQAEQSSLFGDRRIEVIPNGVDTNQFRPYDQGLARDVFNISDDCKIILFGAISPTSDPRKGFSYLQDAVQSVANSWDGDDVVVVVFGSSEPADPPSFGFDTQYVGYLDDEQSLALLYSAADVMVVPSKYEGFGQTVIEAQACGTPVVAFNATGPSDTIVHKETGYLAVPYDTDDLATGIMWTLKRNNPNLAQQARERAINLYKLEVVAKQYQSLYENIV